MSLNLISLLLTALLCIVHGQHILNCGEQNRVDADEDRAFSLTSTRIFNTPLQWMLRRPDGSVLSLATCSLPGLACTSSSSNYMVTWAPRSYSTLTVQQNHRTSIAGNVSCVVSGSQPNYCDVRVVYPARKVSNSSVEMHVMNWTLSASVDVEKIYASDGQYICQWAFPNWTAAKTSYMAIQQNFTDEGKEFHSGKCSFDGVPMPTSDGVYNYSFSVNPGKGILAQKSIQIRQPEAPTLDQCPAVVTEGDDVQCTCQHSDGQPPPLVTWFPGTESNALLQLRNVRMTQNGTIYTCSQHWGGDQKQITYTLHVIPRLAPKDESDMTAEITGGVVVFVVAALVVAIVVIWIRTCNPVYADPRRRSEVEDSHVYSDLASFYGHNVPAPSENSATQYENAGFDDQQPDYLELIEPETTETIETIETTTSPPTPSRQQVECVVATCETEAATPEEQYENTIGERSLAATESYYENTLAEEKKDADGGHYENISSV